MMLAALMAVGAMVGCSNSGSQSGDAASINAQPTDKQYKEAQATEEAIAEASAKPIELGPNDILEFGQPQPAPVVVDFSASWCGPCRQMHPIFDKLAKKYHGKVNFIYVDVDKAPQLAKQYAVEAVPTLLFVNTKGVIDRTVGFMDEAAMEAAIQAIMPAPAAPTNAPR